MRDTSWVRSLRPTNSHGSCSCFSSPLPLAKDGMFGKNPTLVREHRLSASTNTVSDTIEDCLCNLSDKSMKTTAMSKLLWSVGVLSLIAVSIFLYLGLTAKSKILADVTSPTGAWRVVVHGKDVWNGVEVTAVVHTHDGREISLGVIDLRPEWGETEYDYQADPSHHTRIDEVKFEETFSWSGL